MIDNSAALIIGISDYHRPAWVLPENVAKDARDVHALLVNPEYCAFTPEKTSLLTDQDATLVSIRAAFKQLIDHCNKQTTVFVYFSGHGGVTTDTNQSFLLPSDAKPDFASSALSGTEFSQILNTIPSRKMVVILDCCHAGGMGQFKSTDQENLFRSGLLDKDFDELASGYGRVIVASSLASERSITLPHEPNSLFTKHLLVGMKGEASRGDGYVRAMDLFNYLQPKVKSASQGMQNPLFKAHLEENFPLAFYTENNPAVAKSSISLPQDDYAFDAYISYLDSDRDMYWVMDELIPLLEGSGLTIVDSHEQPVKGAARISNMEIGFKKSRRLLLVMSDNYLKDKTALFENVLFQDMSIEEGSWRVIPVYWEAVNKDLIPGRLKMITGSNLAHPHPRRAERAKQHLLNALQSPKPSGGTA